MLLVEEGIHDPAYLSIGVRRGYRTGACRRRGRMPSARFGTAGMGSSTFGEDL
jgi:hypothetical protein